MTSTAVVAKADTAGSTASAAAVDSAADKPKSDNNAESKGDAKGGKQAESKVESKEVYKHVTNPFKMEHTCVRSLLLDARESCVAESNMWLAGMRSFLCSFWAAGRRPATWAC